MAHEPPFPFMPITNPVGGVGHDGGSRLNVLAADPHGNVMGKVSTN